MAKKRKSTAFKGIDYDNLDIRSKKRLSKELEYVHKSGYRISELKRMNDLEFANAMNIKIDKRKRIDKQVAPRRRLLRQISGTKERREGSIKKLIPKYKKEGWQKKGLEKIEVELVQASGHIFTKMSEHIQKHYGYDKRTSDKKVQKLLDIPKGYRNKLIKNQFDKQLLGVYSP